MNKKKLVERIELLEKQLQQLTEVCCDRYKELSEEISKKLDPNDVLKNIESLTKGDMAKFAELLGL